MAYKNFGKSYGGEERPFNFAALLLERLDLLFRKANEAAVEQTPFFWYKVLTAIKRTISFIISQKELKEMDHKLNVASGKIKTAIRNDEELLYLEVEKKLDEAETELIRLMYKYGLYYPKYQAKTVDEQILEDYH